MTAATRSSSSAMDVIDHTDYPGDDVPHAAKLLARRIAVANGPTGPYLVRANSVLVETTDDDHLARLQQFASHIGCQVRRETDHESCTTNRHATIEFEPRSLRADLEAAAGACRNPWSTRRPRGPEPQQRPVRVPPAGRSGASSTPAGRSSTAASTPNRTTSTWATRSTRATPGRTSPTPAGRPPTRLRRCLRADRSRQGRDRARRSTAPHRARARHRPPHDQ